MLGVCGCVMVGGSWVPLAVACGLYVLHGVF